MISSLELINHESHRQTRLDFTPGLNVLIGPSDAGKSGVFRAAYWGMFNRPLGDQMLPLYWEGDTKVILRFDDATISRMKGKNLNHYQLNDNDPINAGSGAPPEVIQNATNMDEVNFQTQVDRAFLMFETPGERGRILNKIAGLDDIDRALDNSRADEQKLRRELASKKAEFEGLETELEAFEDLPEREAAIQRLEGFDQYAKQSEQKAAKLDKLAGSISKLDDEIEEAEKLLKAETELKGLKTLVDGISELSNRAGRLEALSASVREADRVLAMASDIPQAEKLLAGLKPLPAQIEAHESQAKKLERIVWRSGIIGQEIEEAEADCLKIEAALPKKCPTCGKLTIRVT